MCTLKISSIQQENVTLTWLVWAAALEQLQLIFSFPSQDFVELGARYCVGYREVDIIDFALQVFIA